MKKIIHLHIGLPKTGITTIQNFLLTNKQRLKENHILFPETGLQYSAHQPLADLFADNHPEWIDKYSPYFLLKMLEKEIELSICHTFILTSEIFFFVNPNKILKTFFSKYQIKITIFIRKFDAWMESGYKQNLKTGDFTGNIKEYFLAEERNFYFYKQIKAWETSFGKDNINLILLESVDKKASLQQKFISACGLIWDENYELNEDANMGQNQETLAFLQLCPDKIRYASKYNQLYEALIEYSRHNPLETKYKYFLSPHERYEILNKLRDDHEKVAKEYMTTQDANIFLSYPDIHEPWEKYPGLTKQKAEEISAFIYQYYAAKNWPIEHNTYPFSLHGLI